jgi:hypothetical protein
MLGRMLRDWPLEAHARFLTDCQRPTRLKDYWQRRGGQPGGAPHAMKSHRWRRTHRKKVEMASLIGRGVRL